MSYEIYYQRRFIKVGELFIPLFQHGSNNCFEFSWNGREIPKKHWHVLNYQKDDRLMFTKEEINELAKLYDGYEPAKARNHYFETGEFERWFNSGMKSAQPVEYYTQLGNSLYILDCTEYPNYKRYYVKTNEELLAKLRSADLQGRRLEVQFVERDLRLPKRTVSSQRTRAEVPSFYAIAKDGQYLYKLTKYGYRYTWRPSNVTKAFKTEKEAQRYLEKYAGRLNGFFVKQVNEKRVI